MPLKGFVEQNDLLVFGSNMEEPVEQQTPTKALRSFRNLVNVHVANIFDSPQGLYSYLDDINLLNPERLRPGWDTYFMVSIYCDDLHTFTLLHIQTLASLASHRSNCMKRRVGAVLVRERRIVSTGYVIPRFRVSGLCTPLRYNGTPRWLKNCNEGGCGICNGTLIPDGKRECICLHAEENAISEAGRERVGIGAVLYCNT